ncbi:MAG TPA: hypothetical protein VMD29_13450 [Terracidiphilus sp.]|nr:hypothetical protein [Terracidiphilus sp.]
MRIGSGQVAGASLALLVVQLAIPASIGAKYLYQRWRCPSVWTRAAAYDPELPMRGRYLSLQVEVDGCQSTLPTHAAAQFPRNPDGTIASPRFAIRRQAEFPATLEVKDNRLLAMRLPDEDGPRKGQMVTAWAGSPCEAMRLVQPVNFYLAEHAPSLLALKPGEELWIEVTVPPKGPPRPIQLAVKRDAVWRPVTGDR